MIASTQRLTLHIASDLPSAALIDLLAATRPIELDVPTPCMLEPHQTMDIATDLFDALVVAQEVGPSTGGITWEQVPGGYGTAAIRFRFDVVDPARAAATLSRLAEGMDFEDLNTPAFSASEELRARYAENLYTLVRFCPDLADDYLANLMVGAEEAMDEEGLERWYADNPTYRLHCWRSVQGAVAGLNVYATTEGWLVPAATDLTRALSLMGRSDALPTRLPTAEEWDRARGVLAHLRECANTVGWASTRGPAGGVGELDRARVSADGFVLTTSDDRAGYAVFFRRIQ